MWVSHQELEGLYKQINELQARIKSLEETKLPSAELKSRLEDLELWRAKLHSMITTKNKRGDDALNKMGKYVIGESITL